MNENINNVENEIKTDGLLAVSPSPHIKNGITTQKIMLHVIIALLPATIWGIIMFGAKAAVIVAVSVVSCMFFEWGTQKLLKRKNTVSDLSAVVTGLLLAMNLPSGVGILIPIVGAFVAIVVVKQLFGGIGKNFLNPALAARVFLFMSWSEPMAKFTPIGVADATAGATPLAILKDGTSSMDISLFDLFIGRMGGSIGEISALLLIVGAIYLVIMKVISLHVPLSYLGTVAIITFIFPQGGMSNLDFMLTQLLSGGLMLGALFMATDYVTSPVTAKGRIIFGIGCGLLTVFFRYFSNYPEGVSFSILVMNALVWYIDKATKPRVFGTKKAKAEVAKK